MKKKIIIFLVCLVFVLAIVAGMRTFSGEDGWICTENGWEKHGQPSEPMPESFCSVSESEFENIE